MEIKEYPVIGFSQTPWPVFSWSAGGIRYFKFLILLLLAVPFIVDTVIRPKKPLKCLIRSLN